LKKFYSYSLNIKLIVIAIWCLFWTSVHTIVLYLIYFNWQTALIDASISVIILSLLCAATLSIYQYYQPSKSNQLYRILIAIVVTWTYGYAIQLAIPLFLGETKNYSLFISHSLPIRYVFAFSILGFLSILSWLWNNLLEQKEQEQRKNDAEQLVITAELERLRQQLQPHFLFNSLNSISALAGSKPDDARKMIQQLSDFLRGTLKKDEQQMVSFKEELDHLHLYLEIEKVRFGHRLNINVDSNSEHQNAKIPPLLLQPLVENAIKFGLYGTIGSITINIHSELDADYFKVTIQNPYDNDTSHFKNGNGFGLSSISRRLFLLYARNDLIQTERNNNIFTVRLSVPQNQIIQNLSIKNK
jgi:two-component system, LytTR family, sensor kinase